MAKNNESRYVVPSIKSKHETLHVYSFAAFKDNDQYGNYLYKKRESYLKRDKIEWGKKQPYLSISVQATLKL